MEKRIDKTNYYLDLAQTVASRSTCLRRNYGAVIVKDDRVVSTGYNGAPRGRTNCSDTNKCYRKEMGIASGTQYEKCRSVHAEANAIIQADPLNMEDSTLYLSGIEFEGGHLTDSECCMMCKRMIINAGIKRVVARQSDGSLSFTEVEQWVDQDD